MKNSNYQLKWKLLIAAMCCISLLMNGAFNQTNAQQASQSHVTSYNWSQSSGTYLPVSGGTAYQISTAGTQGATFNLFSAVVPFNFRYNGTLYGPSTGNIYMLAGGTAGYVHVSTSAPAVLSTAPLTSTNLAFNMANGGVIAAWVGAMVGNGTSDVTNTGTSTTFIRVVTSGSTPNRTVTIQYEHFRRAAATADDWNFQIVLNEEGGLKSNQIEFNYGSMSFGVATATTRQVGLRGFATPTNTGVPNDVQYRVSTSTTVAWTTNTLGTTDGVNSPTGTAVALSSTNFPASGTVYTYAPCTSAPSYATVPFSENFETAIWSNSGCGSGITQDVPSNNWRSGPLLGNMSWRRQDAGASARWSNLTSGLPPAPSVGTGYAKFHTFGGTNNLGMKGGMDLFINLSGGLSELKFDYVNATGADVLKVYQSTDGGLTFPTLLSTFGASAAWANNTITLTSTSATTVVRFEATSDWGNDDLGIDNVTVTPSLTPPNCAVLVSPADGSSGQCPAVKWSNGGGATSYDVYFGTTPTPAFAINTTNTFYTPPGGYSVGQLYYWKIVPQNVNGPATGCPTYSFTAGTMASCYCVPSSTGTGFPITNMTFAGINNNNAVSNQAYQDFTSSVAPGSVGQGGAYPITMTATGLSPNVFAGNVFIDWNQNGVFTDAGEEYQLGTFTTTAITYSGTINVPAGAILGTTRMRVMHKFSTYSTPCFTGGNNLDAQDFLLTVNPPTTDGSVTNIYSLGSLPMGYGDPHFARARIYNPGGVTLINLPVTLTVSGANSFTNVQTIASLAPGASSVVTFAGFNPTALGTNTLIVTIPNDDNVADNGLSWTQEVTSNIYSYKNPAIANFGGVGFNGATGDFVGKFAASNNYGNSDTINEVQVDFFNNTGNQYQVGIWAADGAGGTPGTLLYTSPTYTTLPGTQIKPIPNIVVSGDFYVGARQIGTVNIGFAYQSESPIRSQSFYFTSPTGNTTWNDFSSGNNPFRFSIQVRLEVPQIPLCPLNLLPANATLGCNSGTTLSWSSGGGGTTSYDVYFSTNQTDVNNQALAALVSNNQAGLTFNTGPLSSGQVYYWKVVGVNNYGESTGCSTQSFTASLFGCYCASAGASLVDEYISTVQIGPFVNNSPANGYATYTSMGAATTAVIGNSFNMSVTITTPFSTDIIYVFVDLNHDGDFNDANELAATVSPITGIGSTETYTFPVNVDASALSGPTAMRIKMGDTGFGTVINNDPCQATFSFGEVEDYRIDLVCGLASASSNAPVCHGQDLNLSGAYTGQGTPVSYSWTGPNSFTSGSSNPVINGVSAANDGTYNLTILSSTGCSAVTSTNVTTSPLPDPSANSNAPICEGNPLGLTSSNNASGQTTSNTYAWAGPSFTSTLQNPSVTGSASPSQSGTYTVTITNAFGCTASASTIVAVNANPTGTAAVTGVSCVGLCDGGAVITPTAGQSPYIFTDGVTVNTNGIFTNAFCEGPASVDVFDDNGCTATIPFTVGHISAAPPNVNVAFPIVPTYACSGDNIVASTSPVSSATTYTWDGPAGTTFNSSGNPYASGSTSVTVNYGSPNGSGYNICVQAGNGCGSTNRRCSFVRGTVNVPGAIAPANNRTVECGGTSANYSIASVGGATSYTWSITGNATVIGTGTNATVNFGAGWTGGNLCVTANTPCYSSAPRCIALSSVTAAPGAITGSSVACPGSSGIYSIPVASGAATYNWVLPANTSGSSSTNSINVNFLTGFSLGNIKVSITSICGVTSSQMIKTVATGLPGTPATINGNAAGLCGQTTTYNCSSVSGATSYTWSTPVGTINSGQGTTSINVTFGSFATGNVCVTANNSCGSGAPRCIPVKGSPTISGSITYTPNPFCANASGVDLQVPPAFGTSSYNWSFPSGVSVVLDLSNEQVVNWGAIGGAVSVTAVNSCGNTTKSITITLGCREAGSSEISSSDGDFNVFPNPASDKVNVSFTSSENSHSILRLMDLSGRVLSWVDFVAQKGINNQLIDLSGLAKGVYMIELKSENINKQTRIIIE